jgi:hypothetical protein
MIIGYSGLRYGNILQIVLLNPMFIDFMFASCYLCVTVIYLRIITSPDLDDELVLCCVCLSWGKLVGA